MGPSGLDDLHEREGETALLAESLARARASASLVVVEGSLRNAYDKLEVRSRLALPEALAS